MNIFIIELKTDSGWQPIPDLIYHTRQRAITRMTKEQSWYALGLIRVACYVRIERKKRSK